MTHLEKAIVFLVLSNVMTVIGEGWSDLLLGMICLGFAGFHLFRSVFPARTR